MKPSQINYLLITITGCLAFLIWGTIIVTRRVGDVNYHAPQPLTQQEKYAACMRNTPGDYKIINENCAKIAGIKS